VLKDGALYVEKPKPVDIKQGEREQAAAADDAVLFKRTALAADEAAWKAAADSGGEEAPPNSLFVQKIMDNV
jgi:hypothetical protein